MKHPKKILQAFKRFDSYLVATIAAVILLLLWAANHTTATEKDSDTQKYCTTSSPVCGGIVAAVGGPFTASKIKIHWLSNQPDVPVNSDNGGYSHSFNELVNEGEYVVSTVAAPGAYEVRVEIAAGASPSKHVYLTYGCKLIAEVKGTSLDPKWSISASYANGDSGTPRDAEGNPCGATIPG